ncbi:MAG: hypothetical protein JXA60_08120 [Candidatus Coatesbacteria bacterium]|nr:hypothetical protein [Candidatus Coatesbacteria bacterium]
MLDYVYELDIFEIIGQTETKTFDEILNRIAKHLTDLVDERIKKGLYKTYLGYDGNEDYLRGRLKINDMISNPVLLKIPCLYRLNTIDIKENRIILYTLYLLRNIIKDDFVSNNVMYCFRILAGCINLQHFTSHDCHVLNYNRLNEDYVPIHNLCAFFLDLLSPSHEYGDERMIPFVIDMPLLFEKFVASYFKKHMKEFLDIEAQKEFRFGKKDCKIDLLLRHLETETKYILDTKYKDASEPSNDDIYQVSFYATQQDCKIAYLLYPKSEIEFSETTENNVCIIAIGMDLKENVRNGINEAIEKMGLK